MPECDMCRQWYNEASALSRCGKCRNVLYCSKTCQKIHWPVHRSACASFISAMKRQLAQALEEANQLAEDQWLEMHCPMAPLMKTPISSVPTYHEELGTEHYEYNEEEERIFKELAVDFFGFMLNREDWQQVIVRAEDLSRICSDAKACKERFGFHCENFDKIYELSKKKPGDILDHIPVEFGDETQLDHSYFGATCEPIFSVREGSTHIILNFKDFGLITMLQILSERQPAAESNIVRVIGFDSSLYAVARAKVLLKTLQYEDCSHNIFQIWWSSCWSEETYMIFRGAVKQCLKEEKKSPSGCASILEQWLNCTPLTRVAVHREWMKLHQPKPIRQSMANLLRAEDRAYMMNYQLTGELLRSCDSSDMAIGNVLMFGDGTGNESRMQVNELVFDRLPIIQIIRTANDVGKPFADLVDIFLNKRIDQLQTNIGEYGLLEIEAHYAADAIHPSDQLLNRIKSYRAHSIYYDNSMLDYMPTEEFHNLAQKLSMIPLHQATSIAWSRRVYGTHITDYLDYEERKQILDAGRKEVSAAIRVYDSGQVRYLNEKPTDNYKTIAHFHLAAKYGHFWVLDWLKKGRSDNLKLNDHMLIPYCGLAKYVAPFYLSWTYRS